MSVFVFIAAMLRAMIAEDPAFVVRRVQAAVEGDSVAAVTAPWRRPTAASTRSAAFGLATAARLTYDYVAADRLYDQVIAGHASAPDRWTVFARVGQGQ